MIRCPFYGFRWPEETATLLHLEADECGLDTERNQPCFMESDARSVNFFSCPYAVEQIPSLISAKHIITFTPEDGHHYTLGEWEQKRGNV